MGYYRIICFVMWLLLSLICVAGMIVKDGEHVYLLGGTISAFALQYNLDKILKQE